MASDFILLTKTELAKNCKMDLRTINKRIAKVEPAKLKGKRGQWFLFQVGKAIFAPDAELGGTHDDLTSEKTRLTRVHAEKNELELKLMQKEVCSIPEWEAEAADFLGACRAKLLSLPAQLANRITGDRAEIEEVARDLVFQALGELSADGNPDRSG